MLDLFRRGERWLTAIFIAVIGLVFAIFIGVGGPLTGPSTSANSVVELNGQHLGLLEYERVRTIQESRIREQMGEAYDPAVLQDFLDAQALRVLVDGAILAYAAEELGLRVGKQEIQAFVRSNPGFRDADGRFDPDVFIDQVEYDYGSRRNFVEILRRDLLRVKLGQVLYGQARVSEGEARSAARQELEKVQIAFVALDTAELPPGVELSDDDVKRFVEAHEEAIRALYAERVDDYQVPAKVRARHILFRVDRNAEEVSVEEVRSRAQAALARIREGASFEDVALELSEDPGSVDQGGDLGFFARGERTPVLEEAAFSQQPMEVSEVVRSDVGFHIVRTEEHRAGGELGFEQASLELGSERAARERAREIAEGLSEEVAAAVREGASLEDAARGKGLTLTRTAMLKRRPDHFIPGLGASAEVMATAFSLDLESPSSERIFRVDSKLVLIQLLARTDPDEESLAEATATQREQLLAQKRDRLVQDWVAHTRAALVDQNRLLVNTALVNSRR